MKYSVNFSVKGLMYMKDVKEHLNSMEKAFPEFTPFDFEAKNIAEARKIIDGKLGKDLAFELKGELTIHNCNTNKSYIY